MELIDDDAFREVDLDVRAHCLRQCPPRTQARSQGLKANTDLRCQPGTREFEGGTTRIAKDRPASVGVEAIPIVEAQGRILIFLA